MSTGFVGEELLKKWASWDKICPVCRHVCPILLPVEEEGQIMCAWCAVKVELEAGKCRA